MRRAAGSGARVAVWLLTLVAVLSACSSSAPPRTSTTTSPTTAAASPATTTSSASTASQNSNLRRPASDHELSVITGVPDSALLGAASEVSELVPATPPPRGSNLPANLQRDGKPTLLYIGAEFCPICATERWPMIIALSRFGTFNDLQVTHSALDDGDIPTWSFYGATFTSSYFNFDPVEVETNTDQPLQTPNSEQTLIWTTYYDGQEEFPFIDFDQQFVLSTEQYPDVTLEGRSFDDILGSVGSNDTTVGSLIDASAAQFTKYLCVMDGDQPASTCSAFSAIPATISNNSSTG